jgi:hypothetical protein
MVCKICNKDVVEYGSAIVLSEFKVRYFRCINCGFIFTESPYWLDDAYSNPINESDLGIIRRNIRLSYLTRTIITLFFNSQGKFLDFGGGYGIFTRMMRDAGYNFYHYDEYCENLFARQFEISIHEKTAFELLSAFELFEHLESPVDYLGQLLQNSENILLSTELLPSPPPALDEWWYFGLDHGQHISFYTRRSLELLAKSHNLNFVSDGKKFHLVTKKRIPKSLFRLLIRSRLALILGILLRKSSLLPKDYFDVTGRNLT